MSDDMVFLDIDMRLLPLWETFPDTEDWEEETLREFVRTTWGDFLRCAYGHGYCDALKENADGELGKLCRDHGYALPKREKK